MKTILSVDGGGMKGYIPCVVLAALEQRSGKPCYELFDMFAGTSIGGILACLFASGHSASDALKFFTDDGPAIFGKQQFLGWHGLIRPRYGAADIERCLKARLGGTKLSECKKALLVPAFDLTAYEPYFFKGPVVDQQDQDYCLWEVARATSAAQTYFPAAVLGNMVLWDGGNVVNNPAACAVAEAVKLWREPVRVLSLCCGAESSQFKAKRLVNAGVLHVALETMALLFAANDELPDYVLRHVMPKGYYRIRPGGTEGLAIDGADPVSLDLLRKVAASCVLENGTLLDDFLSCSV